MVSDPRIGKTISHYKIVSRLGGGGMGVVYMAEDIRLKRTVALKFLALNLLTDEQTRARFMQEARAASTLDHPRIGTIYEVEETDDGDQFIAMAYYRGDTLKQKIEKGLLPADQAIKYVLQIADGLAAAHERGIVHRDVKPANIIITEEDFVKIVDFGLARFGDTTRITKAGTSMGTPAYMSPEQVRGLQADHRSDIWSVGVILFEMLTGWLPFKGMDAMSMFYSIVNSPPDDSEDVAARIPAHLRAVIHKALSKDVEQRYQSLRDLTSDLSEFDTKPTADPDEAETVILRPPELQPEQGETRILTNERVAGGGSNEPRVASGKSKWLRFMPIVGILVVGMVLVFNYAGSPEKEVRRTQAIVGADSVAGRADSVQPLLQTAALEMTSPPHASVRKEESKKQPAAQTMKAAVKQKPEVVVGSLAIDSEPAGAQIAINDDVTEYMTPHAFPGLRSGGYRIKLTLDGYVDRLADATVRAGEQTKLNLGLKAKEKGNLTVLALVVQNESEITAVANIYVNGQPSGQTPGSFSLDEGGYTVEAKLFEHTALKPTQEIQVRGGEQATIIFKFVKKE